MSEQSEDSGEEEEVEIEVVDDPESYIQTRRLQDIFEARKDVRDQRLKTKQYQVNNSENQQAVDRARRLYRASVENYLTELRPLFLSDELGKQYWYNLDLGSQLVEPNYYTGSHGRRGTRRKIDKGEKTYTLREEPSPKEIDLKGLNIVFQLPDPMQFSWDLTVNSKRLGQKRDAITVTNTFTLGFGKLDQIVNEANNYLRERGIELDPEEGLPEDELQL